MGGILEANAFQQPETEESPWMDTENFNRAGNAAFLRRLPRRRGEDTTPYLKQDMLKIAIVGCGKIADSHLEQLARISDCRVVATCDRESLMARQLAERFKIPQYFSDLKEMLKVAAPDVVHVTTPPESHFAIAKMCLEAGSHVYVEKPFTLNTTEAEELIALAEKRGRKITVGHDLQFNHAARRMRKFVDEGFLGGRPVHMEK